METAVEKLAITRVVNNWLMVGVLEAKACQLAAGGRERLAQALKTLAFFQQGTAVPPSAPRLPLASIPMPGGA